MKPAITAVLVVLALQALSIGASQSQSESAHINEVDFSDAAVFDVVSAVDLGTQKIDLSRQFIDISGVLRALQNVLNAINQQIQNSTNALANAISNALRQAETVIANVINDWNSRLQGVIDEAARLNATVAQCQAQQQPNFQTVKDALNVDVQQCVSTSTTAAQAALAELSTLGPQAQALLDQASQDIADCASAGLLQALCVAGRLRPLALQGVGLAASATQLGAKVTVELVVQVPMQSTLCVGSAVQNRTAQAAAVIEAIRQCVRNGLATATTTAATP